MPFETVNNLRVYYEVHGEGEPIILMHHGFGSTKIWKEIYPGLVAEGHKVVMFDRRGFGKSEGGHDFQEFYESDRYRPESLEELRVIKKSLGIKECHLVGQCEGGVVGVDYAIKFPQEVKTIVIGGTQCYSETSPAELNATKLVREFRCLEPRLQAKMIEWHGEAAESLYNQFTKYGGAYGKDYYDLRPILPLVPCPTLVLYPDRSPLFEVEQAVTFYRNLSRGELAIFPRCGHNTYEQRPEEFVRTVIDFLRRNAEGAAPPRVRPAVSCLA